MTKMGIAIAKIAKIRCVSRTLSGLFLVGALDRLRRRKRTNREKSRTIPARIGKIPEKSGKSQKVPKRKKKDNFRRTSPDRATPPFEPPPRLAALERWASPSQKSQNFGALSLRLEPPYTGVPRPSGPEIPQKSQIPGLPAWSVKKVSKKCQMTRKRVKKTTKSVFGDFFDTFLTLPTGRPGKSFLRLFGDSGARGCGESCIP